MADRTSCIISLCHGSLVFTEALEAFMSPADTIVYILWLALSICSRPTFFTAPKNQFWTLLQHYCGNLFNLGKQCVHVMCCSSVLACRNGTELHKVLHPRAGWSGWCGVHWRGGGVWPGGPGAAQEHQSTLHEGAGTRSSHSTLAGKPWHELCL